MTYVNAVKYLNSKADVTPSPERMRLLCRYLSDPQRQLRFVHIAGGSGKTSCAEMLSVVLNESGYRIGTLTTSFEREPREMISVNNAPIPHNDFAKYVDAVANAAAKMKSDIKTAAELEAVASPELENASQHPKITKNLLDGRIPPDPSFSEIICAAAFLAFKESDCNISVLECGASRADPTGIIDPPLVSVVCGTTLSEEQLRTGAGIIRRGTREVVTSAAVGDAYSAVLDACVRVGSRLTVPARGELRHISFGLSGRAFEYRGKNYSIPHCAEYQLTNALITIETVYALRRTGVALHSEDVSRGISKARTPLRFEMLSASPAIVFDCPGSPSDNLAFLESLSRLSHIIGKNIVMAAPNDKSLIPADILNSFGFLFKESFCPLTESDDKALAIKATKLFPDETLIVIGPPSFSGRLKKRISKMLSFS